MDLHFILSYKPILLGSWITGSHLRSEQCIALPPTNLHFKLQLLAVLKSSYQEFQLCILTGLGRGSLKLKPGSVEMKKAFISNNKNGIS